MILLFSKCGRYQQHETAYHWSTTSNGLCCCQFSFTNNFNYFCILGMVNFAEDNFSSFSSTELSSNDIWTPANFSKCLIKNSCSRNSGHVFSNSSTGRLLLMSCLCKLYVSSMVWKMFSISRWLLTSKFCSLRNAFIPSVPTLTYTTGCHSTLNRRYTNVVNLTGLSKLRYDQACIPFIVFPTL